jgi:environmental stress-induced protein Ves
MTDAAGGSVVAVDDLPATPWRNGAGLTRAVVAAPGPGEPAWRVSIATLTDDAVFSEFAGYRRLFLPIRGAVTLLTTGGGELEADADGAVRFDGAAPVQARVTDGPGLAVNVMVRAGHTAHLQRRIVTGTIRADDARTRAIVVTAGIVIDTDGRTVTAPAVIVPGSLLPDGSFGPGEPVTAGTATLLDILIDSPIPATDRTPA